MRQDAVAAGQMQPARGMALGATLLLSQRRQACLLGSSLLGSRRPHRGHAALLPAAQRLAGLLLSRHPMLLRRCCQRQQSLTVLGRLAVQLVAQQQALAVALSPVAR